MTVVAAFPATGKSHLARHGHRTYRDSDSSAYSKDALGEPRPDWPDNYLASIVIDHAYGNTVLCSTHEEVREGLRERGIPYTLVIPAPGLRDEYVQRMISRGSPAAMWEFIDTNWDALIESCMAQRGCDIVTLGPGIYLSDVASAWAAKRTLP